MSAWVVVTRDSYEKWDASTDPDADAELRIAVLAWVHALGTAGPPVGGVFDPFSETLFASVDGTGVWIEYILLPHLVPPVIVIREYHR